MNKEEQKILDMYQKQRWSTYQIAEKLKTYPNKVRRVLTKYGINLRNSKDAQKNALKNGRAIHPTAGNSMSKITKQKISETQGQVWDALNKKQKEYRSQIGKDAWAQKSEQEKAAFIAQAQEAIRKSSRVGSKLEHFLLSELGKQNLRVEFHKEHWLQNQNLQVDLYLPECRTAIEVDGPSHFKPVWGPENLAKNIKADQQKTGLILNSGLVMIRIKQDQSLTQRYMRNTLDKLLSLLEKIKQDYPKENERYFEI
jgi:very-short-patch-repair endonuclease